MPAKKKAVKKTAKKRARRTRAVAVRDKAIQDYDRTKMEEMMLTAKVVKDYVTENKLSSNIEGNEYAQVEGWQFAGALLGMRTVVLSVEDVSTDKEKRYRAWVKLVDGKTGEEVNRAVAMCSNAEKSKYGKEKHPNEFSVMSMAQTRAAGKVYRMTIGWIMKASGFSGTPAEEISEEEKKKREVSDKMMTAMKKISKMKDIPSLEKYKKLMNNGKTFNAKQKKELTKKVDEQIERLTEEETIR